MRQEEEELRAQGLDPKLGRWGQYLRRNARRRKSGSTMAEYRFGTSMKFAEHRKKTLKSKKKHRSGKRK